MEPSGVECTPLGHGAAWAHPSVVPRDGALEEHRAHSLSVKGILYSDASLAALLFWMVYLAWMVFPD